MTQQTELLAPAGDIEAGYAALYYGADAVYLGLPKFSARAEAINFTQSELDEFVAYAHSIDRKVYVAMNTLVQESELDEVMLGLQTCVDTGVDAVIVQDLGIARIVRKRFPSLELHASTQMAIHNLEGALALKKMGFTRVVTARELSLSEIKHIKDNCGIEVETFIHGALCYSYSGLCSFSSFQTTRSANRGKCIYSCRDTFKLDGRQGHLFSMKDLALEKEVLKLKGLSLKIEGRKKSALYVAAVVDYYRRILDTGRTDISLADNIKQIFSRPWTTLHFKGKNKNVIDPDFVGHRGLNIGTVEKIFNHVITITPTHPIAKYDGIQIDCGSQEKPFGFSAEILSANGKKVFEVPAHKTVQITLPDHHPFIKKGDTVYLASSTRVKGAYHYEKPKPGAFKNRLPISVCVFIDSDKIVAIYQDKTAEICGTFSPAKDLNKMTKAIHSAFEKTGDTALDLAELTIQNKAGLFVPMSVLNELRRKLYSQIDITHVVPDLPQPDQMVKTNTTPKWIIKTDNVDTLAEIDPTTYDEIWVVTDIDFDINTLSHLPNDKIRLCLPPIIRQSNKYQKIIDTLWQMGYHKYAIGNLSGLTFLPDTADISFDSQLSCLNTQAVSQCFELGAKSVFISPEDTLDNIQKLTALSDNIGVILYTDVPVFLSSNCVRENDCSVCTQKPWHGELSNGKGRFELISKNCQTTVVPKESLCWAGETRHLNASIYRVDFCHKRYDSATTKRIWDTVRNGKDPKGITKFNLKKRFA